MADAVAELEGVEGARTHRSWWVARAAVAAAAKADGRAVLTLKSGVAAPVSRTALPALRSEGWL
jgi:DNA-binding LytR/AlgR family response regulator